MRISFGQIIIVSLIVFLLFGDIQNLKKKIFYIFNKLKEIFYKK